MGAFGGRERPGSTIVAVALEDLKVGSSKAHAQFASQGHPLAPSEEHELEIFRKSFAGFFDRAEDFGYKPIVHAFQRAKLDIKDPLHWQRLMLLLCWAYFPPKRDGRKRVWTTDNYIKLLQDVDRIEVSIASSQSTRLFGSCKRWARRSSNKRSNNDKLGFGGLKKALGEAKSLKHNFELKGLVYNEALQKLDHLNDLEPDARDREIAKFIKARTKHHREEIARRWRSQRRDDFRHPLMLPSRPRSLLTIEIVLSPRGRTLPLASHSCKKTRVQN